MRTSTAAPLLGPTSTGTPTVSQSEEHGPIPSSCSRAASATSSTQPSGESCLLLGLPGDLGVGESAPGDGSEFRPQTRQDCPLGSCALALAVGCNHTQFVLTGTDGVAGVQLAPAARLALLVDPQRLGHQERLALAAALQDAGELQQLAEPDRLAPDRNVLGHPMRPRRTRRAGSP